MEKDYFTSPEDISAAALDKFKDVYGVTKAGSIVRLYPKSTAGSHLIPGSVMEKCLNRFGVLISDVVTNNSTAWGTATCCKCARADLHLSVTVG